MHPRDRCVISTRDLFRLTDAVQSIMVSSRQNSRKDITQETSFVAGVRYALNHARETLCSRIFPSTVTSPMLPSSGSSTITNPTNTTNVTKSKKDQFVYRYGSKLHAYDKKQAPYPLSYDREVLDL